mmetsp:Transcript_34243/g.66899  ORF Transcript_34243/g.66899 Transcript_34243/m.66899 type:complete len:208 (+) Transcript_34243:296-919(+)
MQRSWAQVIRLPRLAGTPLRSLRGVMLSLRSGWMWNRVPLLLPQPPPRTLPLNGRRSSMLPLPCPKGSWRLRLGPTPLGRPTLRGWCAEPLSSRRLADPSSGSCTGPRFWSSGGSRAPARGTPSQSTRPSRFAPRQGGNCAQTFSRTAGRCRAMAGRTTSPTARPRPWCASPSMERTCMAERSFGGSTTPAWIRTTLLQGSHSCPPT